MRTRLRDSHLRLVYGLEADLGEPQKRGTFGEGRRRIVSLTSGTFSGPALDGKLLVA
jgi:hypothetical protein